MITLAYTYNIIYVSHLELHKDPTSLIYNQSVSRLNVKPRDAG
jgi:hypothetical protein